MKPSLLLLHGALGSARQLQPLAERLAADFEVHTFSFGGHGGQPLDAARFTMTHFAAEVSYFLAAHGLDQVHVFGYSMGGYAAVLSAASDPGRIRSITTYGTRFDWSPETAAAETAMLEPAKMQAKIPQYVEQLQQAHAPTEWHAVVEATAAMLRELGEAPPLHELNLSRLSIPVQVLVGELDKTAGVESSRQFAAYLPEATFEVLPNTPHPLERADLPGLALRIREFARANA
ncbi:alpha/beta hydrolase [Hymenobacter sp. 15J16-1T3B]|uniref:alpha/beta fold hydrolase n=1 Tax=Hymenobacter sp. 15J16-1T3B TaxID=2886941 RepID=UPI001D1118C3|nr:alpha/beta fold hydrolase [Hymenobacter sp. 15J16-1T3B]MCC3159831.1 alpha/beta hydrolase [Hymenobacter sp. 15J16-1T3B]